MLNKYIKTFIKATSCRHVVCQGDNPYSMSAIKKIKKMMMTNINIKLARPRLERGHYIP